MFLRRRHRRFGRIHLRLRRQILGLCIVQFLLRNQPRPSLGRLLQPFRLSVQSRVFRLGAIDLVLRPRDLFFALLQLKHCLLQLRLQLRHFQNRQRLALMHDVADIHIDARHVAANLGVHIHNLVGLELTGQRQHMGNIAPLCCGDLRGWNSCGYRF